MMNKLIIGVESASKIRKELIIWLGQSRTHMSCSLPYVLTKDGVDMLDGEGVGSIWGGGWPASLGIKRSANIE
jgi:hypothetical protein